jgi:hypothetical protein
LEDFLFHYYFTEVVTPAGFCRAKQFGFGTLQNTSQRVTLRLQVGDFQV